MFLGESLSPVSAHLDARCSEAMRSCSPGDDEGEVSVLGETSAWQQHLEANWRRVSPPVLRISFFLLQKGDSAVFSLIAWELVYPRCAWDAEQSCGVCSLYLTRAVSVPSHAEKGSESGDCNGRVRSDSLPFSASLCLVSSPPALTPCTSFLSWALRLVEGDFWPRKNFHLVGWNAGGLPRHKEVTWLFISYGLLCF